MRRMVYTAFPCISTTNMICADYYKPMKGRRDAGEGVGNGGGQVSFVMNGPFNNPVVKGRGLMVGRSDMDGNHGFCTQVFHFKKWCNGSPICLEVHDHPHSELLVAKA